MNVRTVSISKVALDPANVRTHDERNLKAIADSLRLFGQRKPIVVMQADGGFVVIAGNGTLEAARLIGWDEIAVAVVPDNWTSDEAAAYAIADNRSAELAEWDQEGLRLQLEQLAAEGWDVDLLGFDALDDGDHVVDVVEDEPPAPGVEAITQSGDTWILGEHRLVCGDSTKPAAFAAVMDGEQAECVWTDPPYGVSYVGGTADALTIANDDLSGPKLRAFLTDAFTNTTQACAPGAAWYVAAPSGPQFLEFAVPLTELGIWRQTLAWVKNTFALGHSDYHYQHESIFYGWLPNGAHRWHGARTKATVFDDGFTPANMKKAELVQILDEMLEFSSVVREDKPQRNGDHPTMKPVRLVARLVANSTNRGEIVLDPFGGSGTTLIACEQLGRRCRTIEFDPIYCDVIVKRWENLTGGKAVLADEG